MKYLLAVVGVFVLYGALGQNIVPNPSFESDTGCPYTFSQINLCVPWGTGNEGTPDYYNACDSHSISSTTFFVPNNWMGTQAAFSGHAYAGFYGYSESPVADYHEYLMAPIPALDSGATYRFSMEVSLADSSGYASNGLGVRFNTFGGYQGVTTIPVAPHLDFTSFGIITNTTGWTRLSGSFIADSAYTYLVIGVFKDSGSLFKYPIKSPPWFLGFTYYYIDSITMIKYVKEDVETIMGAPSCHIYPNPLSAGSATCTFSNPSQIPYTLTMCDMMGREVFKKGDITDDAVRIERADFLPGIYVYRLTNAGGGVITGRFIVN